MCHALGRRYRNVFQSADAESAVDALRAGAVVVHRMRGIRAGLRQGEPNVETSFKGMKLKLSQQCNVSFKF